MVSIADAAYSALQLWSNQDESLPVPVLAVKVFFAKASTLRSIKDKDHEASETP